MEFQEVVRHRRMIRNFQRGRAVPPEMLQRILDNARRAPSAGHTQGWSFLVLEGPAETGIYWDAVFPQEKRDGFAYPGLFEAPLIIVPLSCKNAYLDRYAEPDKGWTDRDENRWPTDFWTVDTAFSAMLILLTVVDLGLAALFFGIFDVPGLRRAFGVPDTHHPIGAIAIGYPAVDRPSPSLKRGRQPLDAMVHRGRWGKHDG